MSFLDDWGNAIKGFGGAAVAQIGVTLDWAKAVNSDYANWVRDTPVLAQIASAGDPVREYLGRETKSFIDDVETIYREGVSEPISTAFTASRLARQRSAAAGAEAGSAQEWGQFFKSETWLDAYELAQDTSIGQAATESALVSEFNPVQDQFLGMTQEDIEGMRENSTPYNLASGAVDFTARWYLDPANVAGRGISAGRQLLVKAPVRADEDVAKAVDTGRLKGRTDSIIKNTKTWNAEQFLKGVDGLSELPDGAAIASALSKANKVEDAAERTAQMKLVLRLSYGDSSAVAELGSRRAELLDELAKGAGTKNNLLEAAKWKDPRIGLGAQRLQLEAETAERLKMLDEADELQQAEVDRLEQLQGTLYGTARARTLRVTGRSESRAIRQLEQPVSQAVVAKGIWNIPTRIFALPFKTGRALSTMRPRGYVFLDDPSSPNELRSMFDQVADFPAEKRSELISKYIEADGPGAKMPVVESAKAAIIAHKAKQLGYTKDQAERAINSYVARERHYFGKARGVAAQRFSAAASKESGLPADTFIDEAGNVNVVPQFETQLANAVPTLDVRMVDRALKHEKVRVSATDEWMQEVEGRLGAHYRTAAGRRVAMTRIGAREALTDFGDGFNKFWKFSVLFRLGYPLRVLTDDQMRIYAKLGSAATALQAEVAWSGVRALGRGLTGKNRREAMGAYHSDLEKIKGLEEDLASLKDGPEELRNLQESASRLRSQLSSIDTLPESRVRGSDGKLVRVYHGTPSSFDDFDPAEIGSQSDLGSHGRGFYFTRDPHTAARYADGPVNFSTPNIRPAYLDIRKPWSWDDDIVPPSDVRHIARETGVGVADEDIPAEGLTLVSLRDLLSPRIRAETRAKFNEVVSKYVSKRGYDGIHKRDMGRGEEWVALRANQIKVAFEAESGEPLLKSINELTDRERELAERLGSVSSMDEQLTALRQRTAAGTKDLVKRYLPQEGKRFGEGVFTYRGIDLSDAFGGAEGQLRKDLARASYGDRLLHQGEVNGYARTARAGNSWGQIEPNDPGHMDAWLHAVNLQIQQDKLGMRLIRGESDEEILKWLRRDPEGKAYAKGLPFHSANQEQWVANARATVDQYIPADEWRQTLQKRHLTAQELQSYINAGGKPPAVHGALLEANLGSGAWSRGVNGFMSKTMNVLSELPSDKLSRHPLYTAVYRQRAKQEIDFLLADPHRAKLGKGENIDADDLKQVYKVAHSTALKELKSTLYDITAHSNAAEQLRFLSPFMGAWQETLNRWWNLAKDKPQLINYFNLAWQMPNKTGLVVDREGQVVDDAGELTDDEFLMIQLPGWAGGPTKKDPLRGQVRVFDSVLSIPKGSFNLVLQGDPWYLPGFGPIVQAPVSAIAKEMPEIKDIAKFVNPMGSPDSVFQAVEPSTIKRLQEWRDKGQTRRQFAQDVGRIYGQMRVDWEKDGEPEPWDESARWEEAERRAGDLYKLKAVNNFLSPFPATFRSPNQFYTDAYNLLKKDAARDPNDEKTSEWVDDEFLKKYPEYFEFVQSTSKNNLGLNATVEAVQASRKYSPLIEKHPDLARYIVGEEGEGEYEPLAAQYQRTHRIRPGSSEKQRDYKDPREARAAAESKAGWNQYQKLTDGLNAVAVQRGLLSYREDEQLAALMKVARSRLEEQNPAWAEDFNTFKKGDFERKFAEVEDIAFDKSMEKKPENASLQRYVALRRGFQKLLAQRGAAGGSASTTAKSNQDLAFLYTRAVNRLAEQDMKFERTWFTPFLERDPMLLDLTAVEEASDAGQ